MTGTGKYDGITGEIKFTCDGGVLGLTTDNVFVVCCPHDMAAPLAEGIDAWRCTKKCRRSIAAPAFRVAGDAGA